MNTRICLFVENSGFSGQGKTPLSQMLPSAHPVGKQKSLQQPMRILRGRPPAHEPEKWRTF